MLRGHTGLEKRYRNLPGTFAVEGTPTHLVPVRAPSADDGPRASPTASRTASGSRARRRREGARRARKPDLGRGRARRRVGRAGLGRRSAHRGDRGRAPRRRRRTWPTRCARSIPTGNTASACSSTTWSPGSKEARLAEAVRHPHVLVTGTPYVDVWQAVRPSAVGIDAWPVVPKGQDWKTGVCAALGVDDPRAMWRRILGVGPRLEAARAALRRRGRAAHRLPHRVTARNRTGVAAGE